MKTPWLGEGNRLRLYYFLVFSAFGLYLPFFPTWLEARGYTGVLMSAVVALTPIASLFSPPLTGLLADHLGLRGKLMSIACALTACGISAMAFIAGVYEVIPFIALLLSQAVFALFRAPAMSLAEVLALEHPSDYGGIRLFGSIGFLCAAFCSGRWLDPTEAFALPAVMAGLLWLVFIVSLSLPRLSKTAPRPALKDAARLLKAGSFRRLALTVVLTFIGFSCYHLCFSLRLTELGASANEVGSAWGIATIAEVFLMARSKQLISAFGAGRLLTFSLAFGAARWLLIAAIDNKDVLLLLQPLHAISFGLMWVSAMAVLKREIGTLGMGTGQGLYMTAMSIGSALGIWLWGPLMQSIGAGHVFWGAAIFQAAGAVFALGLISHDRELASPEPRVV